MASWDEIERVRKDPTGAALVATRLVALEKGALTEWELDFCESIQRRRDAYDLTTRQAEKLLEIRDSATRLETYRGFSMGHLLKSCHEARFDLEEVDQDWIEQVNNSGDYSIRRKHIARLMRCAAVLNLIEAYELS